MENRNDVEMSRFDRFSVDLENLVNAIFQVNHETYALDSKAKSKYIESHIPQIKDFLEKQSFIDLKNDLIQSVFVDIDAIETSLERDEDEYYRDYLDRLERYNILLSKHIKNLNNLSEMLSAKRFGYLFHPRIIGVDLYIKHLSAYEQLHKAVDLLGKKAIELGQKVKKAHHEIHSILTEQPDKEDTIKVTLFFRKPEDRDKTIFGIPSYGHMAMELCPADKRKKNKYISLYPDLDEEQPSEETLMDLITYNLHIPSAKLRVGQLVTRGIDEQNFPLHLTVELPCRNILDFDAVYTWSEHLNAPVYQFYGRDGGDNCSSIILKGLSAAGTEKKVPYKEKTLNFINPHDLWNHVNKIQTEVLNDQIINGKNYSERQRIHLVLIAAAREIQCLIQARMVELANNNEVNEDFIDSLIPIYKYILNLSDRARFSEEIESSENLVADIKGEVNKYIICLGNKNTNQFEDVLYILKNIHANFFNQEIWKTIIDSPDSIAAPVGGYKEISTEAEIVNIRRKALACDQNMDYRVTNQDLLEKYADIENGIHKIKELVSNKPEKTKSYGEKNIEMLRTRRGFINQHIYFDQYASLPSSQQNIFNQLKKLLPNDAAVQADTMDSLLHNQINKFNTKFIPEDKFTINPFKWYKNWMVGKEHTTNQNLYTILKSKDTSLVDKKKNIIKCIDENKPGWWEFWRGDDSKKYQEMNFQVQFLSVIQSFCQGNLDMIDFTIEMEKLAKAFPEHQSEDFKNLIKNMGKSYIDHLDETKSNTKTILASLFRNEVKDKKEIIVKASAKYGPHINNNFLKAYRFFAEKDPAKEETKFKVEDIYHLRKWMN